MSDEPIRVFAEMRVVEPKVIGIWVGKYKADGKEEWVWLPRSQVHWHYLNRRIRRRCAITMPEWLADDRGL